MTLYDEHVEYMQASREAGKKIEKYLESRPLRKQALEVIREIVGKDAPWPPGTNLIRDVELSIMYDRVYNVFNWIHGG